jgi:phosphatidylglycerophosphatase A
VTEAYFSASIIVGSWFGIGFFPIYANAVAVFATMLILPVIPTGCWHWVFAVVVLIAGFWASAIWETRAEISDDGRIVIDEAAGYILAVMLAGWTGLKRGAILAALFVLVDGLKPWPIQMLEGLPFGLGVMADDLGAGLLVGVGWIIGERLMARLRR